MGVQRCFVYSIVVCFMFLDMIVPAAADLWKEVDQARLDKKATNFLVQKMNDTRAAWDEGDGYSTWLPLFGVPNQKGLHLLAITGLDAHANASNVRVFKTQFFRTDMETLYNTPESRALWIARMPKKIQSALERSLETRLQYCIDGKSKKHSSKKMDGLQSSLSEVLRKLKAYSPFRGDKIEDQDTFDSWFFSLNGVQQGILLSAHWDVFSRYVPFSHFLSSVQGKKNKNVYECCLKFKDEIFNEESTFEFMSQLADNKVSLPTTNKYLLLHSPCQYVAEYSVDQESTLFPKEVYFDGGVKIVITLDTRGHPRMVFSKEIWSEDALGGLKISGSDAKDIIVSVSNIPRLTVMKCDDVGSISFFASLPDLHSVRLENLPRLNQVCILGGSISNTKGLPFNGDQGISDTFLALWNFQAPSQNWSEQTREAFLNLKTINGKKVVFNERQKKLYFEGQPQYQRVWY